MCVMWSVLGASFVLGLWGMQAILNHRQIAFNVGQWIVYVVWLLWTLFGVAFVWTSMAEGEARAAKMGALVLGGVSVVSAAVLALFWVIP